MEKKNTFMVGLFVALGSLLIFAVILLLGQESSLFESRTTLYIPFENVAGLKPGSPVRLAGVTVGTVNSIDFAPTLDDKKMYVEISVQEEMMPRIRQDSIATIGSKGLLGDKVVDITIGAEESAPHKAGDFMHSEEPPDMFRILEKGQTLITHAGDVAKGLKEVINKLADDKTIKDVKGIIESLDGIFNEVESGKGIANALIYNPKAKEDVVAMIGNVRVVTYKLRSTADQIDKIVNEVRSGDGIVHGVIYGDEGKDIMRDVKRASGSIAKITEEIVSGEGMLHTLVYDSDKGNILRNLEEATDDLRKLANYIESGQGTLGALIKDPTVFEDLKLILGNLRRNSVLKSLIRYSISKGEKRDAEKEYIPEEGPPAPSTDSSSGKTP